MLRDEPLWLCLDLLLKELLNINYFDYVECYYFYLFNLNTNCEHDHLVDDIRIFIFETCFR